MRRNSKGFALISLMIMVALIPAAILIVDQANNRLLLVPAPH